MLPFSHRAKLVGYFIGDVGAPNQIVHLWKFADDADRRRFRETVFADETLMAFARKLRPLIDTQENKLLLAAPLGTAPLSRAPYLAARERLESAERATTRPPSVGSQGPEHGVREKRSCAHQCAINATEVSTSALAAAESIGCAVELTARGSRGGLSRKGERSKIASVFKGLRGTRAD